MTVSSDCVRILVGTKRGKREQRKRKNAEQLSEWKQDQSSSVHGAELSYKAGYRPWLSENELTSNIRRSEAEKEAPPFSADAQPPAARSTRLN